MKQVYAGTSSGAITEEEKREIEKLGILQKDKPKSVVQQTIEVARILASNGVDLRRVKYSKSVNGKTIFLSLREIEQEGIDIGKIIEENGLEGDFPYGKRVSRVIQMYRGTVKTPITESEREEIEQIGLVKLRVSGQDIGKASFDSSAEKCNEAQGVLASMVEKTRKGGVTQSE